MISFRYHIVSIVSVFLALAIGVALGGGPLKGEVDNTLVEQVEADRRTKETLRSEIASLRQESTFTDAFAGVVAGRILPGTLPQRVVTVVVLPGAAEAAVTSVSELVTAAGGTVGGVVIVGKKLVDPSQRQLVDELALQLSQDVPDVTVPEDASGYDRMGALLARAVGGTRDRGTPVDAASNQILSGLGVAELASTRDALKRRGSLVVVVSGRRVGDAEEPEGVNTIVTSLVTALDAATDGVVVAGPIEAAEADGLLAMLRSDVLAAGRVSTVDVIGGTPGSVVTMLALAEQAAGQVGHYGAVDAADGALPGAVAQD